ncbi:hypothetical protein GCM10022252_04230 [Streptosporangium oxazolinicum]|uniref:Uncharacterized protein n=1 Tax=Streptosporangium oxazolinicum TaxID=909287 RepID=A0ABP8AAL2_9ACTN
MRMAFDHVTPGTARTSPVDISRTTSAPPSNWKYATYLPFGDRASGARCLRTENTRASGRATTRPPRTQSFHGAQTHPSSPAYRTGGLAPPASAGTPAAPMTTAIAPTQTLKRQNHPTEAP